MKKQRILICLLLLLACHPVQAQLQAVFSQYMHDATSINPAYAGSAQALALTLQARLQWIKTEGAPNTQLFSAHAPLPGIPFAAGLRFLHETVGSGRRFLASPSFNYRMPLEKGSLSVGLAANLNRYTPGYQNLLLYHPTDPSFALQESLWVLTLGAGFYYATDRFYAGFSVPEITPASKPNPEKNIFSRHLRQYVFHTGKVFHLNNDVVLKPNLLLSIPEQGVAYADLNLNVLFRETIWLGGSYRTSKLLAGLVQLQLNSQWRLGYSWDMPLQQQHVLSGNSHEMSLQYTFTFDRSSVRSPRYF